MTGGKRVRGLTAVQSYAAFEDAEKLTPESMKLAAILGLCVEMVKLNQGLLGQNDNYYSIILFSRRHGFWPWTTSSTRVQCEGDNRAGIWTPELERGLLTMQC